MAIHSSGLIGCCMGRVIYDLGNAHGHARYNSQEEFDAALFRICGGVGGSASSSTYIAVTNDDQDVEEGYLKTQGWTGIETNNLITWVIGGEELSDYFQKFDSNQKAKKKAIADENKRLEQQKKDEEEHKLKTRFKTAAEAQVEAHVQATIVHEAEAVPALQFLKGEVIQVANNATYTHLRGRRATLDYRLVDQTDRPYWVTIRGHSLYESDLIKI